MITRVINLPKDNSFFIFGARGTGKSTLLKERLVPSETLLIDLLQPDEEELLARDPAQLTMQLAALPQEVKWVVIDEIQKLPKLLDVVHSEIERGRFKFALTGSSARKLKRGSANLLAGRAFVLSLFPLTHRELGSRFDLQSALEWGTLPKILQYSNDDEKAAFLRAYAQTYLKEEIQVEQIVRRLDPFRHFLEVAARCNGQILNFSNVARDIGTDTKTVQSYFQILEDTLLGHLLEPYSQSVRKRQRQNPKFYFFDTGVKRALDRTLTLELLPQTYAFGRAFEHFVINEAIRLHAYAPRDYRFSYLRTKDDAEIDLIIERPGLPTALIEIKSSSHIDERATTALARFQRDFNSAEAFVWSLDPHAKKIGGVHVLPWQRGLFEVGLAVG